MEAPRRPLRLHPRSPSPAFFPLPVPFSLFPGVCFFARAGIFLPEGPGYPQVICPGPAGSSPGSDLTSASVLSGVDRTVSPLWELQAQDSPHTQAEEGQPPLALNMVATCQTGSDHRGLRARP